MVAARELALGMGRAPLRDASRPVGAAAGSEMSALAPAGAPPASRVWERCALRPLISTSAWSGVLFGEVAWVNLSA